MAFISINHKGIITAVSDKKFDGTIEIPGEADRSLLGRRVAKRVEKLRVAVIANWGQACGISTYTNYVVNALRPKVAELKVFSEVGCEPSDDVDVCWERGKSMLKCVQKVVEWKPDFVIVQHEFGLFPKAPFLLQMLQHLDSIPYAVVLHSTYEHLDKSVCTSAMKRLIVHTNVAKGVLRKIGNTSEIHMIPHGCVTFPDRQRLWNIFQTEHAIVQFGFGFFYKGVDRAIEAVAKLKAMKPEKYDGPDNKIFYCYYCSESGHCKNIHDDYMNFLMDKVESLGLQDNVAIIKKYNSDQEVNNILRTAKLAVFPYINNPENTVYGASGAIRVAMANGIPVIASESHLFDELPVPRPTNSDDLAAEIDRVFSDWKYKDQIIARQDDYVASTNWDGVTDKYIDVMNQIRQGMHFVID
jgi:glycosyltransferase involved in cell wall biosynthesis